ncbi:MAG: methionine gamma-lyase family protein [Oscillospiraceae bacterium]|nr:methionine gamma-lyase family protein [Oscillospiraceae bacterium]
MSAFTFSDRVRELEQTALVRSGEAFRRIDRIAEANTRKVLDAFHRHRVSEGHFAATTGYGLGDRGRETLDALYADIFGGEAAFVRIGLVSGTHAITAALCGTLRPGQTLLYVTGKPYDTLHGVIGLTGEHHGSLKHYGIDYDQVDITANGEPDLAAIQTAATDPKIGCVAIQRSRGYAHSRRSLTIDEIATICETVRAVNPAVPIFVDNCYGEFVEEREPLEIGADLIAGSLIKNPGGGLAPGGGYVAGRADLVAAAANRATAPGLDGAYGATLGHNRLLYQGRFLAPHTVAQAMKTAVFASAVMEALGFYADPKPEDPRTDIVQMIRFDHPEALTRFCRGIQQGAPIDAYVSPEPGPMPGYDCPVIMAAGAFHQGSTIELSADGPLREPFCAYLQGGLTFESGKLGVLSAAQMILDGS